MMLKHSQSDNTSHRSNYSIGSGSSNPHSHQNWPPQASMGESISKIIDPTQPSVRTPSKSLSS